MDKIDAILNLIGLATGAVVLIIWLIAVANWDGEIPDEWEDLDWP